MENFLFIKKKKKKVMGMTHRLHAFCQCIYGDVSSPAVCKYQQTSIAVEFRSGRGGNKSENIPTCFPEVTAVFIVFELSLGRALWVFFGVAAVRNKDEKAQDNVMTVIWHCGS